MSQLTRFFSIALATVMIAAAPAWAQETTPAELPPVPSKAELLQPLPTDHVLGEEDAPVTIVEYASLSCSHCAHFHGETFPQLKKDYIDTGKARFIFRNFPFNAPALHGAMIAECAAQDGGSQKFHTFLKAMFSTQDKWAYGVDYLSNLKQLAMVGGMDAAVFDACIANKEIEAQLIEGLRYGAEGLGVSSTPTLFINGEMVQGSQPYDQIKAKIDPLVK